MAIGAVAVAAHWLSWLTVAGTLGPTSYMLIAHPSSATSRLRRAVAGHTLAIAIGLAAVAAWGGWGHAFAGAPTVGQAAATALAAALLLALLEILDLHHAPAAATVILVGSGLVPVGRPLAGLAIALAAVIALSGSGSCAGWLAKLTPWARRDGPAAVAACLASGFYEGRLCVGHRTFSDESRRARDLRPVMTLMAQLGATTWSPHACLGATFAGRLRLVRLNLAQVSRNPRMLGVMALSCHVQSGRRRVAP